jgi:cell wall-associated NlpC family hydrolase
MRRWLLTAGLALWLALPLSVVLFTAMASATSGTCGPGGTAEQIQGVDLDAEQLASAQIIVSVVRQRQLPARAAVIAIATAMQESALRNDLEQHDHDSIGLFQQRISIYGADVAGDPVKATTAFLNKLIKIKGWQIRPLTDVAAEVQIPRADLRGKYARWEALAQSLTERFWPGSAGVQCSGGPGGSGAASGGGIPAGYRLPSQGQARIAVAFALAQLGKPYVFGSNGPDTWDCSSLVQRSWAAAGVPIPRVTYDQVHTGIPVSSLAAMIPGDLIFIPGSDGTASNPGHVGMYIGTGGDGKQYLVQAPQSGDVVKVTPVANWSGQIVAVRRPLTQ